MNREEKLVRVSGEIGRSVRDVWTRAEQVPAFEIGNMSPAERKQFYVDTLCLSTAEAVVGLLLLHEKKIDFEDSLPAMETMRSDIAGVIERFVRERS